MHRVLFVIVCVLLLSVAAPLRSQDLAVKEPGMSLMPLPKSLHVTGGSFAIHDDFQVAVEGQRSDRLEQALERFIVQLSDETGLRLPRTQTPNAHVALKVEISAPDAAVQSVEEDESYDLSVSPDQILLRAPNATGAMHGLQTLLQLLEVKANAFAFPGVTIQDAPRFRWRGLMIDCSRHFEPLDVLKRNLDAMAAVKLNVFHWHLMDDQGIRVESKRFPKLTELGSDGQFYTQDEIREVVAYARARGIRVVPEFEMPGHSTAWLVAYPELNSGTKPEAIRRVFGVSNVALDPTREETYTFLSEFLAEMATLFPDQYIHIGGDETPAPDWKTNPRIVAFMRAHNLQGNAALQAYFNQKVLAILTRLHRRMVGWDEIFTPGLPKDIVIQSWRGAASLAQAAEQGYEGVLSAPYYLDGMQPASKHYLADPVPADTTLTTAQQRLILGGEICMWAEHINERTIDSRIWPRAAAIAERFWSPQDVRDVDDMYRRLQPESVRLEKVGLRHLSSEDRGLRSLAGSQDIQALQSFATAFEPVSFGERASIQHTMQFMPLTDFVDAVVPDPPVRYRIERAADTLTAAPQSNTAESRQARSLLEQFFTDAGDSVPRVETIMEASPRLAVVRGRAEQLQQLAVIGKQALLYLQGGAPPAWKAASLATITAAKKPDALVRFHFLDPLTKLVNAAH